MRLGLGLIFKVTKEKHATKKKPEEKCRTLLTQILYIFKGTKDTRLPFVRQYSWRNSSTAVETYSMKTRISHDEKWYSSKIGTPTTSMLMKETETSQSGSITTLEIVHNIVRDWGHSLQCCPSYHKPGFGTFRLPLSADNLSPGFGLCFQLIVTNLPKLKLFSASRRLNMLHSSMDSLPYDPIPHLEQHEQISQ